MYATLADARIDNKANLTTDDAYLLGFIRTISRRVDREFGAVRPVFEPYIEARKVLISPENVNTWLGTLMMPAALLSLTSVSVGGNALTVGTDVFAYPDSTMPPFGLLQIATSINGLTWGGFCNIDGSRSLFATVTGIWGVNRDYANAWPSIDVITTANINASVGSFTVADVDGADPYGLTPRISAGNLLKIGTEYMEVTATDITANSVSVRRGVNGSTAAAHVIGDAVAVWQIEEPVRSEVARQAAFKNARRGAYNTVQIDAAGGEVRFEADMLTSLRAVIQDYAFIR